MKLDEHVMHLYCDATDTCWSDNPLYWATEFRGQTLASCLKQARNNGWKINNAGEVTCPKHNGK